MGIDSVSAAFRKLDKEELRLAKGKSSYALKMSGAGFVDVGPEGYRSVSKVCMPHITRSINQRYAALSARRLSTHTTPHPL